MKHLYVINPKSFLDASEINLFKKRITDLFSGEDEFHIHVSRYPRDAVCVVRKYAMRSNAALSGENLRVYAVGGDGILFDCLNGLIGFPSVELASVPYGSSNDLARAISNGNMEKLKDVKSLLSSPSVPTDTIRCSGNYFINFCSLGVESAAVVKFYTIAQRFSAVLKSVLRVKSFVGWLFTLGGIVAAFDKNLVNQYYKLTIDGHNHDGHYASINFSNSPCYGSDKTVAPEAVLNDGLIEVLLVKSVNSLKLLSMIPHYIRGNRWKYPKYITHIKARDISVSSELPIFVNMDGECFLDNNIKVKMLPSSVKIIAGEGPVYKGGEEA
jgi:diacylglycerol kinase family enzyme